MQLSREKTGRYKKAVDLKEMIKGEKTDERRTKWNGHKTKSGAIGGGDSEEKGGGEKGSSKKTVQKRRPPGENVPGVF